MKWILGLIAVLLFLLVLENRYTYFGQAPDMIKIDNLTGKACFWWPKSEGKYTTNCFIPKGGK